MLLLAGLGNPGEGYARNRHNVGFMAVEAIARRHGFGPWRSRFQGDCAEGLLGGEKVLLLKPTTFMNESGRSVGEAARFYKLSPAEVAVFHDELDLAPFKVKVKVGGGAAGHNGLRSITAALGPEFKRVRLGIGHPGSKERVLRWVLGDFAKAEAEDLERLLDALAEAAPLLARNTLDGDNRFMSQVNQAFAPPRAAKKPPGAAKAAVAKEGSSGEKKAAGPGEGDPQGALARALSAVLGRRPG